MHPVHTFTIKVPNGDEGIELGEYEAAHLPRVGDPLHLWHPMLCPNEGAPFEGVVSEVRWEAFHKSHPFAPHERNSIACVVWLAEYAGAPTLYCTCTTEELARLDADAADIDKEGACRNCGYVRRPAP